MTKTSLLFLGIFAILALLILAGFVFLPKEQPMPQVQAPSPTPFQPPPSTSLPTPAVQPFVDPTATWKTSRNEIYGVSIKYPEHWKGPSEKMNGKRCGDFLPKDPTISNCWYQIGDQGTGDLAGEWPTGFFTLHFYENREGFDLESFTNLIIEDEDYPLSVTSKSALLFKGQPTIELKVGGRKYFFIALPKKPKILKIDFPIAAGPLLAPGGPEYIQDHPKIFNTITFWE